MNKEEFIRENCPDRHGTNCSKWDILPTKYGDPDLISMWVADMDFKAPREVTEALRKKVDFGIYGYSLTPDSYYQSFIQWEKEQHGWEIQRDWIRFAPGVVTGIFWCMHMLTKPGDAAIINMPVYYPFHHAIEDIDRRLIYSELVNTGGIYTIDFEDFEKKVVDNDVKVFILCSPHNPVGRVWTREELERIGRICIDNNVLVVSDEIHFDLVMPGYKHIMFGSISEEFAQHSIVCTAPSKTFNLAGMQASNMIIANEQLREKFVAHFDAAAIYYLNILSYKACEIAYTKCDQWLEELLGVIRENRDYVAGYLAKHHPQVKVTPIEATYLLWMDFRALGMDNEALEALMQKDARLFLDEGYVFGEDGSGFERMNLACPKSVVEAAMARLTAALENHGR